MNEQPYLSRIEAAELLRISPRYLDKLIRSGELPAAKLGSRVLLRREDLERFVQGRKIVAA